MYRLGFIVERALGHTTHGKNLLEFVSRDPSIEADWGFPAWDQRGWAGRLPLLGGNWTVQAGLQARRQVAAMERRRPLQALFFHTQVPAVLAQDWLRRRPGVVSLDATPKQYDALGLAYQHSAGPAWLEQLKWRLNRACFQQASRLVTWSAWAKHGLVDEYGVPPDKVSVIPPGVDTPAWAAGPRAVGPDQPVKILFVGGDLDRKGGQHLLRAFRQLRSPTAPTPVELHLVTQTALPPEPGLYTHSNLKPNSPALRRLYHDSTIFCLPTLGDCLPLVLAEAAAAGLPLVSTAVAAIPELVRPGETGLLVPPGDEAALAAALRQLIDNPPLRAQLGGGAQRLAQRDHDGATNAGRLLALLKAVVDEAPGARPPA